MGTDGRISYYIDKYGVFHKSLRRSKKSKDLSSLPDNTTPKPSSTWLRLIMMFWNPRVMKAAFRFGVAAVIMNQYERLGFALLLLCFTI
ncbi:hypothetical protein BDFB_007553 [Asbolus verrucosus]|uniref:Uncharacterized protein n=1 Tax=Asbolus verrucosus TaxID=1661398 RepID=A0A482VJJ8_ASBVE|nr:hypothetical protein BDFB_007553 [Asbolus verrucosus]